MVYYELLGFHIITGVGILWYNEVQCDIKSQTQMLQGQFDVLAMNKMLDNVATSVSINKHVVRCALLFF